MGASALRGGNGSGGVSKEREVVIIRENVLESIIKDATTFASLSALIGLGWLIDSTAMQWLGALMGILAVGARASGYTAKHTYTIAQARARLDELGQGA
jgi:hypothetical protein